MPAVTITDRDARPDAPLRVTVALACYSDLAEVAGGTWAARCRQA